MMLLTHQGSEDVLSVRGQRATLLNCSCCPQVARGWRWGCPVQRETKRVVLLVQVGLNGGAGQQVAAGSPYTVSYALLRVTYNASIRVQVQLHGATVQAHGPARPSQAKPVQACLLPARPNTATHWLLHFPQPSACEHMVCVAAGGHCRVTGRLAVSTDSSEALSVQGPMRATFSAHSCVHPCIVTYHKTRC